LTLDLEVPGVQGYNSVNIDSLNTSSCAFSCPHPPCRPLLLSVAHRRRHAAHQTYVRFPRFYQERTEDSERNESKEIQRYCLGQVVLLLTLDLEVPGVQGYYSVNIDSLNTSSCAFSCPHPPCRPLLLSVAHRRRHAAHQTYVRFPRFYQERTEDSERNESKEIQRYCRGQVVLLLTLDSEVPGVQGYNSVNIDSLSTSSCAFSCPTI
jgi:hypothetical protein